jgi:hypothetical protein
MTRQLILIFICLCTIIFGCNQQPSLNDIDLKTWRNDIDGCNRVRLETGKSLIKQKEKLLGLTQTEIRNMLGKPDKVALYKRSQRFYVFYLTPSGNCENFDPEDKILSLYIRFSALDIANEMYLHEDFYEEGMEN